LAIYRSYSYCSEYSFDHADKRLRIDKLIEDEDVQKYYKQDLRQIWSLDSYKNYENVSWHWHQFPFDDDFSIKNARWNRFFKIKKPVKGKSIIEIGSAMGQAYSFMKDSGIIDVSDYTGLEISDMGHQRCKEKYPEANWVNADFTKYEFDQSYDYAFERHAIHHMPNPLQQYQKLMKHVNISMSTIFRGCIEGSTISNLDQGFFRHGEENKVYINVINIFELVQMALSEGFNHIRVVCHPTHEEMPKDPNGGYYLAPDLQANHLIMRCGLRCTRCLELDRPLVYAIPYGPRLWVRYPWNIIKIKIGINLLKLLHF